MSAPTEFLPMNLRPRPQAPRPRTRRLFESWIQAAALTALFLGGAFLLAGWRLEVVQVTSCPGLPPSAQANLEGLAGSWIPSLDLETIRQDVERWPGVAGVAVELKLPSTLRIQALPDEICASVKMGRTWRGVTCNGSISRRLAEPWLPIFENFDLGETELRSALTTGSRLSEGTAGRLVSIRKITPSDYEITFSDSVDTESLSVVRVLPQGTSSELWWKRAALSGHVPAWADLRLGHRIVVRRAG